MPSHLGTELRSMYSAQQTRLLEAGTSHLAFEALASVKVTCLYDKHSCSCRISYSSDVGITSTLQTGAGSVFVLVLLSAIFLLWCWILKTVKFVSRCIVDVWACQALTGHLHFMVKVLGLGGSKGRVLRIWGNVEGCSRFVWSSSFL